MITVCAFDHGWYYHYRLHKRKIDTNQYNQFSALFDYLDNMQQICPNEFFKNGPRGSKLFINLGADIIRYEAHELSLLTKEALNWKKYKTAHSNVECFMLNFDNKTLAVEVPVWFLPGEMPDFEDKQNKMPLTGHIDILRIDNGKIWILDYKPKAVKEKFAVAQTYFYALMLSKRTGIPLSEFMCGYFDEKDSFLFQPKPALLSQ